MTDAAVSAKLLESGLPEAKQGLKNAIQKLQQHDIEKGASMKLSSSELKVGAGSEFRLPVFVQQTGTIVKWSFHLDERDGDIGK